MINFKNIHDAMTEIVIHQLHYFDYQKEDMTCTEINNMRTSGEQRYLNDYVFNARVKCLVSSIITGIRPLIDMDLEQFANEIVNKYTSE